MAHSKRLRLSDVRNIFRLIGEVRELGADPPVWRQHMLQSLSRIIGGAVWIAAEGQCESGTTIPHPPSIAIAGAEALRNIGVIAEFLASDAAGRCPVLCTVTRWKAGCHSRDYSTGWIDPSFDARTWHTSALLERIRAAGVDDGFVFSKFGVPGGRVMHGIGLLRLPGEPPCTERQTRLLQLFHRELGRFWCLRADAPWSNLPPRLRQTLDGLRSGRSEKQIAADLGLSRHTVHDYVKDLHRRFAVSSLGELLAKCAIESKVNFVPRLNTSQTREDFT